MKVVISKIASSFDLDGRICTGTLVDSFWQRRRERVGNEKAAVFTTRISGNELSR